MVECTICLETIDKNDEHTLLCNHKYHDKCISFWLKNNSSCPICRKKQYLDIYDKDHYIYSFKEAFITLKEYVIIYNSLNDSEKVNYYNHMFTFIIKYHLQYDIRVLNFLKMNDIMFYFV